MATEFFEERENFAKWLPGKISLTPKYTIFTEGKK
jgi:hypothetical protein